MSEARRLPLAALRARLDEGSARSRWLVDPDGVRGRVLELPAGAAYTVGLALGGPVSLCAQAMLLPHDWRDLRGTVRAAISVRDADGRRRELCAARLRAGDRGPGGMVLRCGLPARATALALEVHPLGDPSPGDVARAIFVEPTLHDPGAAVPDAGEPPDPPPTLLAADSPLFSVLVPVHDPPPQMLEEAIESVRGQTFTGWELCLVDDGSSDPEVIAALEAQAARDPRVRLRRHRTARGISAATNTAIQSATGTYIALLDHDDTLAPDALEQIAQRIAADPTLDMLYTDEDIVDDGRQVWIHLKPAWSPDTLRTNGYTCHLGVYRRALVRDVGGFRSAFDGSQDIDMILRLVERTDRIAHVPRILYHWRIHPASTAGGDAKPYAFVAARNAIAAHLERIGVAGEIGYGPPGLYRLAHRVDPGMSVDLVLAITTTDGLSEAAASWLAQPHPTWSLVLTAPPAVLAGATELLTATGITADRLTTIPTRAGDHPAGALAHAAQHTHADHLLLMQAPAVGLTHDWLTRLLGYSEQPQIAAGGPIVLAPDGRIQHAGVALPDGIPLHLLHGARSSMDDLFGYGTSVHNVSAVSGVLITPSPTYRQVGGLNPEYHELTLIEYCLRAGEHHHRIVTIPDTRLRTTGPDPTTNDLPTTWRLQRRWARTHTDDPYYNINYRSDRGDFRRRPD